MKQITVNNITVDVIYKDIKNIHLAVYPPTGRVRIAVPLKTNEDSIRLYIITKSAWIKRQQKNFRNQERQSPREFKNRESHYFLGKRYLLNIIEEEAPPRIVLRTKTYLDLYIRPNTDISKRNEIMNEWYRKELKVYIPDIITKWEKIIGVRVNEWQVRIMRRKWGACNIENKRIWLNLELAKKPLHCLEYIIVHEMVHLLERHHNQKFIEYMDLFLPNWTQSKSELNKLPVSYSEWDY